MGIEVNISVTDDNRSKIETLLRKNINRGTGIMVTTLRTKCNYPIKSVDDGIVTMRWELSEQKIKADDIIKITIWK